MLFTSFNFIVFFIVTVTVYYLLPHRLRWGFLLAASLVFYMAWKAELVLLILFSSLVNYLAALLIERAGSVRRPLLVAAMLINFGLLFVFKYLMFANQTLGYFLGNAPLGSFSIILPLGISFYTFQAVGYVIDVYRRNISAERNYFKFTYFLTFFPQLVAGPIERFDKLFPQLFNKVEFSFENVCEGLKIMAWGFFKKLVIADRAAFVANTVFNSPKYFGSLAYLIATVFFAFQIYCDFSGYSEIAQGGARVLGIRLMDNFKTPYLSKSVQEFWRRWHISLSSWFKDYVYFPLGGSRVSVPKLWRNLMVTFLVSGLWHGANWTFVIFGALNGLYQVAGDIKNRILRRKKDFKGNPAVNILRVLFTFSLICVSWVFFRANTVGDAFYILSHAFWGLRASLTPQGAYDLLNSLGVSIYELIVVVFGIVFLCLIDAAQGRGSIHEILNRSNIFLRYSFYTVVILAILLLGVFTSGSQFIYFQF